MKISTLIIFFFYFSFHLYSQQNQIATLSPAKNDYNLHSSSNHVYKYVISDKKLITYFINNSIPINFPEYDSVLDLNSNKQIAIDWSLLNLDFFKPSYRVNVGQYFD